MELAIKAADLSHPAKLFSTHAVWTLRMQQEFADQATKEQAAGLVVTTKPPDSSGPGGMEAAIAASQLGFFKFVVFPL